MLDLYLSLVELNEKGPRPANSVFVCEHASNKIPSKFSNVGVDEAARQSHVAWGSKALGPLHDSDARLAEAMFSAVAQNTDFKVEKICRTVRVMAWPIPVTHALSKGLLNVMIEIRNDLIKTIKEQEAMTGFMAALLIPAIKDLKGNLNV